MRYPIDRTMRRTGLDIGYWASRKDKMMYKVMRDLAHRYCGNAKSAIDIGSYIGGFICDLDWIPDRTASDLNDYSVEWAEVEGVRFKCCDAFKIERATPWDLVISNQAIEHIQDAKSFGEKLCTIGKTVLVSTTYQVPHGRIDGHVQDPIDLAKFLSWFPRKPKAVLIVADQFDNIVGLF